LLASSPTQHCVLICLLIVVVRDCFQQQFRMRETKVAPLIREANRSKGEKKARELFPPSLQFQQLNQNLAALLVRSHRILLTDNLRETCSSGC
jgi:hypothetical protein